ncbi:MAG: lipoyl synthase [Candidatus Aminicenantes bacterium]|nr:lipoyl synthase [Candidatus Aminicenantes bacterium]
MVSALPESQPTKKPYWLKVKLPSHRNFFYVSDTLKKERLNTICQSAKCPNVAECWSQKTATFLILGDICTRGCAFCAVEKGVPSPPFPDEPAHVAEAVSLFGLRYAVITSVTRDDLSDGGASFFAETITAIKNRTTGVKVEVLIPDFKGDAKALEQVSRAQPDILNHNLETTERLYPLINRPRENYHRSLDVLKKAKEMGNVTKSGLMIGLGEKKEEIIRSLSDLREASCDLLTIGQYLQPSKMHAPVRKYYTPLEFEHLKGIALDFGFKDVESGPLVRSSYKAHKMYNSLQEKIKGIEECVI